MLRGLMLLLALSLPLETAYGFAPAPLAPRSHSRAARRAVALRPGAAHAPARPRRVAVVASAAAAAPAPTEATRSLATRIATTLLCTVATVLLTACRALAVATAKRAAATAAPGFEVTGDMVKWGGVGLLFGAAYIFRRDENPIVSYVEDEDEQQRRPPAAPGMELDAAAPMGAPTGDTSDDSMFNALTARMVQLAKEKDEADAAPPVDETQFDSSDSWGEGSTAVLEPPRPGKDDDERRPSDAAGSIDFPVGFPLVDFDDAEVKPSASEDEIAMLNRMFGTKPE